ncbi:MAG: hypothetical protein DDT20_00937 [Firmicutes bacterium]|nr:hypothetical protein [Bacillota bacterium]
MSSTRRGEIPDEDLLDEIERLQAELAECRERERQAIDYATKLAVNLHRRHYYPTAFDWEPLPDVLGLLTQIDHMTGALWRMDGLSGARGTAKE